MQIVIDIPEMTLLNITSRELLLCSREDIEKLEFAIRNGTPLPKGHGDLIDRNELKECIEIMNTISGESKYAVRMDDIRNMSTIIEAERDD